MKKIKSTTSSLPPTYQESEIKIHLTIFPTADSSADQANVFQDKNEQ
jgi:hypothetical protein